MIYLPFLTRKKVSLIKEDFYHLCKWQNFQFNLFTFYLCFASIKQFRSVVYRRLGKCRFLTCGH